MNRDELRSWRTSTLARSADSGGEERGAAKKGKKKKEEKPAAPAKEEAPDAEEEAPAEDAAAGDAKCARYITAPLAANVELKNVEMVLCQAASDDPHWLILHKGHPVAAVKLSDQPSSSQIRGIFVDDSYPMHLLKAASEMGLENVLKSVQARYYYAQVNESAVVTDLRQKLTAKANTELATKKAAIRDNILGQTDLVLAAMEKNRLAVENPLKVALFDKMIEAQMDPGVAERVINEAFIAGGRGFFKAVLEQSQKWSAYTPEAMSEIRADIEGSTVRTSGVVSRVASQDLPDAIPLRTGESVLPSERPGNKDLKNRLQLRVRTGA